MSNRFTENVFLPACRLAIKLAEQSGGNVIAMNDFLGMWCVSDSYNLWKDIDGNGNEAYWIGEYWGFYDWQSATSQWGAIFCEPCNSKGVFRVQFKGGI